MRILLNTSPLVSSDKTGIGYYVSNLYEELIRSGIEVHPTVDTTVQPFLNTLRRISSRLREIFGEWYPSFVRDIGDVLISLLLRKESTLVNYDLYHETTLDAMPEIKIRSICNLYDLTFVVYPELLPLNLASSCRTNVEKNITAAKRVIVNTKSIKDEAVDLLKLNEEKIDVIPLAPSRAFQAMDKSVPLPKQARRLTVKDYILYVGTVEPRKGLKTLILAFRDIRRKYDLSLVIAGGLGWLYDDIISYPEKLGIKGDVLFTGYIAEASLFHLYRHASVFVYPSLYEGFGLPPLEAMACGIPVIISDIPSLREVAGDAAIAFNPKDPEELAHALDRVLSSESSRIEMKNKGLLKSAEYSWEKVVTATIQTYQKALKD